MVEQKDGCVKPARGLLVPEDEDGARETGTKETREEKKMLAKVGREAIDFEANAYVEGEGFKTVKLSDYRGKWIVLCFYPGDFTFV